MKRSVTKRHSAKAFSSALYARERAMVAVATLCFALACMTYVYFLCVSVVNVVMRQETDTEIASVGNEIAALESRYIEAQTQVTKEQALARGFGPASEKVYVTRTPANLVLGTKSER